MRRWIPEKARREYEKAVGLHYASASDHITFSNWLAEEVECPISHAHYGKSYPSGAWDELKKCDLCKGNDRLQRVELYYQEVE